MSESEKKLDVRGLYCPSPVMQTVVELAKMQVGQTLFVLYDINYERYWSSRS